MTKTDVSKLMASKGYLTVSEVAAKIGKDQSTVLRWIGAKRIRAEKFGSTYYVALDSVVAHIGPRMAELLGLITHAKKKP